ncbi:hypothetical protein FBU59_007067, partial [Linderina macrospora]
MAIRRALQISIFALCVLSPAAVAQAVDSSTPSAKKPLDIRLFHSLNRAGAAVVSPDSTKALFTQSHYDQDENKSATFINLLDLSSGNIIRLTEDTVGSSFSNPLWFDDSSFGYMHKNVLYHQQLGSTANATEVFAPPIDISSV